MVSPIHKKVISNPSETEIICLSMATWRFPTFVRPWEQVSHRTQPVHGCVTMQQSRDLRNLSVQS